MIRIRIDPEMRRGRRLRVRVRTEPTGNPGLGTVKVGEGLSVRVSSRCILMVRFRDLWYGRLAVRPLTSFGASRGALGQRRVRDEV